MSGVGLWKEGYVDTMMVTQASVFAVDAFVEMRKQFDACKAEGTDFDRTPSRQ